jgi:hypothetical protein
MIHFQLKNENMELSDSPHGHVGSGIIQSWMTMA